MWEEEGLIADDASALILSVWEKETCTEFGDMTIPTGATWVDPSTFIMVFPELKTNSKFQEEISQRDLQAREDDEASRRWTVIKR